MLVKITNADITNIAANTAAKINLLLLLMFCKISVEINGRNVGDTSPLYLYCAYLKDLLNYSKETQNTRFLCKGWTKNTTWQIRVTGVGGANDGLNARAATFMTSAVVELVVRPHVDVFHQDRLIPPKIHLHMKLILAAHNFVCKSAVIAQSQYQQNSKMVIQGVNFVIHTTQLTSTAHNVRTQQLQV